MIPKINFNEDSIDVRVDGARVGVTLVDFARVAEKGQEIL